MSAHNHHGGNGEAQKPYIEFIDVCKAFGSHVVLDHVNFFVLPGETLCMAGTVSVHDANFGDYGEYNFSATN